MSNAGPGPVPARFISPILAKAIDYVVTAMDLFSGSLILEMDATAAARTVTMNPNLGTAVLSPTLRVMKVDLTANPVVISDGTNTVDAITAPATALGQINGWRNVYSNGTNLRSSGAG